jgi:metallo-beta-lactamase family protein
MSGISIQFLGATGTVTGSKYLVQVNGLRLLVDCGLFQGWKQLRQRNWEPLPVAASSIDAVILTHAHIDHSGYLPLLVKQGFKGPIYCTEATAKLCGILLPDCGHLQEEDAGFANRHGFSRHAPALPLYTVEDAKRSLLQFRPGIPDGHFDIGKGVRVCYHSAGHILGAAMVELELEGKRLLFTGDLGRPHDVIMNPPTIMSQADWLVVESTYGNRVHDAEDPRIKLAATIRKTAKHGGVVLIPTFAVGRAQSLLFLIDELMRAGEIPPLPIYLDSPMAVDATEIFCAHTGEHRLSREQCQRMASVTHLVRSVEESKTLNQRKGPMIILAASGMATGGRILHHLKTRAPNRHNTILFSGYQAGGTRGAAMLEGASSIRIHGETIDVRAHIDSISNISAHADSQEIMDWLRHFSTAPRQTFIVHGEPDAADALRQKIESRLKWPVTVPYYLQKVDLV